MKSFNDYIFEKSTKSNIIDTGINKDIMDLSNYMIDIMRKNNLKRYSFRIEELSDMFPFLRTWDYNNINIYISPKYMNSVGEMKLTNSVGIFLKSHNKGTLNHELIHVLQSTRNRNDFVTDYKNKTVLNQIKGFFRKNVNKIDLLKSILYTSDKREMEAFIHSFRKYESEKKTELLSYILLLKYFDLTNLISNTNTLRQFIMIWYTYYESSIPFFDRLRLNRQINNNTLEINKKEVKSFIQKINKKLNDIGNTYLRRISNQYLNTAEDVEKFAVMLNDAKQNIVNNKFKNLLHIPADEKLKLSPNRWYDMNDVDSYQRETDEMKESNSIYNNMKYVKNFKTLFPINESRTVKDTASLMNALLVNVFATYKSNMKIESLFKNSNLGNIPLDIYDFFTDVKSLLQLGESGIQEFGDNMGVGDDEDVIVSIITTTYKDKFKRDIMDDLDECIFYLKDNNLSEQYLNELIEFKNLLKK